MYDAYLGGKDNYAADREAVRQVLRVAPEVRDSARANRAFLQRAVRFLAGEAGLRQFIDIGTGIPTAGSVHQVAAETAPATRVVYVDNDPIVHVHANALLTGSGTTRIVLADLREPEAILQHPKVGELIDFRQPVGLLLVAILHFITEEENATRIVAPRPGCPWTQDGKTVADHADPQAQGRARLLRCSRHQAMLTYVNAYDHLLTLARVLGSDGAMPLFSHTSLSRAVCEAAVRFAWLMDPGIPSEERIVRGAVALFVSADERLKSVRGLPAERFDRRVHRQMIESCTAERDAVQELITGAGLTFGHRQNGKTKSRLELESPKVSVPLKINVTELMAGLLPDSPSWYNIGSSVTHSLYWGLRDVDGSRPGEPLALTPNVLDVGAAAESAISASGLILDRCGRCYGHDPSAHIKRTMERREAVDALMRRATRSTWAHIPAEPQHRGPRGRQS